MDENQDNMLYYSNRVELTGSGYELKMVFQQTDGDEVRNKKEIVLSWPHAKDLLRVLSDKVEEYEKLFSPIVVKPNADVVKELKDSGKIK